MADKICGGEIQADISLYGLPNGSFSFDVKRIYLGIKTSFSLLYFILVELKVATLCIKDFTAHRKSIMLKIFVFLEVRNQKLLNLRCTRCFFEKFVTLFQTEIQWESIRDRKIYTYLKIEPAYEHSYTQEARVVGGREATPHQFPYQVSRCRYNVLGKKEESYLSFQNQGKIVKISSLFRILHPFQLYCLLKILIEGLGARG